MKFRVLVCFYLLLSYAFESISQTDLDIERKVDSIFKWPKEETFPAGVLMISKDGKVISQRSMGFADLEHKVA